MRSPASPTADQADTAPKTIRASERTRSAGLRAISAKPSAELRGATLVNGAARSPVNSPFLVLAESDDAATSRGLADALAMVLRHNDPALHRELAPRSLVERIVFDMLEQLRCISLAPDLDGVQANLSQVVVAWDQNAQANGVAESGVGLLIYTTAHMARARLGLGGTDEQVDSIIEGPRARLAKLIGHALAELAGAAMNQAAFATAAGEIARLVAEMAADTSAVETDESGALAARYRMLIAPDWFDAENLGDGDGPVSSWLDDLVQRDGIDLNNLGGYRTFTKAHDVMRHGHDLYSDQVLRQARRDLDAVIGDQAISAQRLGKRLRVLLSTQAWAGRSFAQPQGRLDRRRLAQLVAAVDPQTIFEQPRPVVQNTSAVTLLLDNSGSMKSHRYETLAVLADVLSRSLDLAGVPHEILGHTTESWVGGASMKDWKSGGRTADPGRVADLSWIVYKDFETPWRRARHSMAATFLTQHFRESVDGEAVIWAHQRLLARPEARRLLVVVSDGAPAESGTAMANGGDSGNPHYLAEHFARVVRRIEQRSPVAIAALSIAGNIDTVFSNTTTVDLNSTLSLADFGAIESLIGASRWG